MRVKETIVLGIKACFEANHRWQAAPEAVAFLRNYHRHLFNVTVKIPVEQKNREVEFFIFQRSIQSYLSNTYAFKNIEDSCETIASDTATFVLMSSDSFAWCEVTIQEDAENFATVRKERV